MKEVTLVITSCGRFDLLEETLDSFFECNTYPIKKIIITEDSTEGKKLERLISKYNDKNNNFKLIVNETRLGQLKSIDKAYREVDTKYIFHCEDDWKFLKKGFIEKSMELMEEDEKILVVGLRDKKDFAKDFFYDEDYISKNGEKYYSVKGEIFTYNPALRRKKDMDLFGLHEKLENQRYEEVLSDFYKEHGFKTIFFVPTVFPMTAIGLMWYFVFMPTGALNTLLTNMGLKQFAIPWLVNKATAMNTIVGVNVWAGIGYYMVIILAGLTVIPKDLYEAASIDGANPVQMFFNVTIPMLKPTLIMCIVMDIIGSVKVFDLVYAMTSGGPNGLTNLPTTLMISEAFKYSHYGVGSAIGIIIMLICLVGTVGSNTLLNRGRRVD